MQINEKHRPSGVTRRIHTRDANGKKQSFDYIENLPKYNKHQQFNKASKFQRINARPVEDPNGEDIDTVLKDGTIERKGLHLPQGYYNVNNVGGTEHWGIDPKTFNKKYEADPTQDGVYKPKGGPMLASNPLKRNTSFQAPWGGRMDMKAGSRILQDPNNAKDTYGIGGDEFDSTYKFDESKNMNKKLIRLTESDLHKIVKESIQRIMNEGWFGNDKKYGEKWYNPLTWMSKADKAKQDQWAKEQEERERKRASDKAMAKEIERRRQMDLAKWKKADEQNDLENRREIYQRCGM